VEKKSICVPESNFKRSTNMTLIHSSQIFFYRPSLLMFFFLQDPDYCTESCTAYCAQEDRTDGLSGSVSAQNGEVGILGGSFGKGTVPKGEDKVSCCKRHRLSEAY
jgi:hypothetical protein